MPIDLSITARDKDTLVVDATFKDEESITIPTGSLNTIQWSLYNESGSIVNSREDVSVSPVANPTTIVLTGDDLAYSVGCQRKLLVEVNYDSTNGNGLNLRETADFDIEDLMGV